MVVESVNKEEINPLVPPVRRRRERTNNLNISPIYVNDSRDRPPRISKCIFDLGAIN